MPREKKAEVRCNGVTRRTIEGTEEIRKFLKSSQMRDMINLADEVIVTIW